MSDIALMIDAAGTVVAHVHNPGKPPKDMTFADAADHGEATIGEPVPWPRAKRDALLAACDWTQQPDVKAAMAADKQAAWVTYRAALRNLPTTSPDPRAVTWPVAPA